MIDLVAKSASWGAIYSAIFSILPAVGISFYWQIDYIILIMPLMIIAGVFIGFFLFLLIGCFVSGADLTAKSYLAFPIFSFIFFLLLLFTIFTIMGGLTATILSIGGPATFLVWLPVLAAATLSGHLVGRKLQDYYEEDNASLTSE